MRQDRPLHRNIPLILLSAALLGACSHETRRENPVDPAVSPSVQLLEARFDSTSASVGLLWTRYDGHSELSHYAVLRKVAGLERVDTLARLTRATDTTFHDTMVHSGTEYSYRVAIVTTGGVVRASAFVTLSSYALPAPDLLPQLLTASVAISICDGAVIAVPDSASMRSLVVL
jgi:hypothetical protein